MRVYVIDLAVGFPGHAKPGDAGMDLCARESVTIGPKETKLVPCNVIFDYHDENGALDTPVLIITPRSSLWKKHHVILTNSIGIIDKEYCGYEDEIKASLYNPTEESTTIEKGERIVQALLIRSLTSEPITVSREEIRSHKSRGGFGSTD